MSNTMETSRLHNSIYLDDNRHIQAIDRLVYELKLPAEVVNSSYREILDTMKTDIRLKAFLPILVSRKVKEKLQPGTRGLAQNPLVNSADAISEQNRGAKF